MTTGFGLAVSRLVTQQTQEEEDADDDTVSLLSTSSEEDRDSESDIFKSKRIYAKYRKLEWATWTFEDSDYFYTEEEYTNALWDLAHKAFGGLKENGFFLSREQGGHQQKKRL